MLEQDNFDKFILNYNETYLLLLTRASRQHYDCLVTSWRVLKDLYNVIQTIYDGGNVTYNQMPYPFTFRGNDVLLSQLGFHGEEVQNIYEFLDYVRQTQGKEFEQCMDETSFAMCARIRQ